jgi:hypothetical protein
MLCNNTQRFFRWKTRKEEGKKKRIVIRPFFLFYSLLLRVINTVLQNVNSFPAISALKVTGVCGILNTP